jgi:hypothetical protein
MSAADRKFASVSRGGRARRLECQVASMDGGAGESHHRRVDGRWSISGLASMGAHGALVTGCLWWTAQHPAAARGAGVTELEIRSVPAVVEHQVPGPAATVAPVVQGRALRARRVSRPAVAAPAPVSHEESPPTSFEGDVPDGDEDHSMEEPSPSTLVETAPPPPPAPVGPPPVTALEASYLCTQQRLRSLPKALNVRGRTYRLQVQACISAEGRVENVTLQKGAVPELDAQVITDVRGWRYRPRIIEGKPSPFCYKVRVSYEVE